MHLRENLASIFKNVKMSLSSSSVSTTPPIPTPDPDPNPIPPNLSCSIHNTELENTLSPPLSPSSRSPSLQPDLTATCEALVATETEMGREGLTPVKGVPVYVMMPLDSVTMGNEVNRKEAAEASLKALIHNTDLENTLPPPLIPHSQSPLLRPDLTATCEALVATETATGRERLMPVKGVPVYVMMPLDSVTTGNEVNRKKAVDGSLKALKSAGVEGVMMDVWWGLVEREGPRVYNWGGYNELIGMAKEIGLKVQAVMSFHHCGGNVGDSCSIPLPKWVTEEIDRDPDLAYTDQWGRRSYEYISLGVDTLPVLKGRTPVQCYADFMDAFKNNFKHLLGDTVVEIQVGMGPAGELRYPSYPEQNGIWKFPGIGAFQCYDKYMLSSLKSAAEAAGEPEWGSSGPRDAGHYNNWPEDTRFFRRENGGWDSPYGKFFLSWYSQMLLDHGERVLSNAQSIFETTGVKISVKIAGIHWHYGGRSHPPELTAGYYNTRFHDGYIPIAQMLARYGAIFNFTCIEMRDHEQPQDARCLPEKLVRQVALATSKTGVPLAGENALPRYDETAYHQILNASSLKLDEIEQESKMCAFTYLRMNQDLFQPDNWRKFVEFVKKMKEVKQQVERDAEHSVHVTRPLVQVAAVAY